MGSWDKGLEFEPTLRRLLEFRKFVRSRIVRPRYRATLRNVNILILALTNGLRISEAIECYYKWLETGERKVVVRVAKSKDRYRLCVIPEVFDKVDWAATRGLPKPLKQTLNSFARRNFGFNTHSLRYAFINYLLSRGVDVPTVSRIVGHRSINTILSYIQSRRAEETLEEVQNLLRRLVR